MYEADFAVMLKSYEPDLPFAKRLVESFHTYRADEMEIFVIVPDAQVGQFEEELRPLGAGLEVLSEHVFSDELVDSGMHGLSAGYINQQIIKLAFASTGLARNYLAIDSDVQFLRSFTQSDFVAKDGCPYCVLSEDAFLKADPVYFSRYWQARHESLSRIYDHVGLRDHALLTCHGNTVLSSEVVRSFRDEFLRPRSWKLSDALEIAPYEFGWYSAWLVASEQPLTYLHDPFFHCFHTEEQYMAFINRGHTLDDLSRGFIGVVLNSNWYRKTELSQSQLTRPEVLAGTLAASDVLKMLVYKIKQKWQSSIGA